MSQHAFVGYELAKRDWARCNPAATPAEFEAACARFARMFGI